MFWNILGWIFWGASCIVALTMLFGIFNNNTSAIRRVSGLIFGAALFAVLAWLLKSDVSKLHLIWLLPVAIGIYSAIPNNQASLESGNATIYPPEVRDQITAAVGRGDREEAMRIISEFQDATSAEFREQGLDLEGIVPTFGMELPWRDAYKQVFRVHELIPFPALTWKNDVPVSPAPMPYGYLLVDSPILNFKSRIPIIHRDDFMLIHFYLEDTVGLDFDGSELLTTYVPKSVFKDGRSKSASHVMHYCLVPEGTLEAYYDFENDVHMRFPQVERIFGELIYSGTITVGANESPNV